MKHSLTVFYIKKITTSAYSKSVNSLGLDPIAEILRDDL